MVSITAGIVLMSFCLLIVVVLLVICGIAVGWSMLRVLTAIRHALKAEEPPGLRDNEWTQDQGRDVR